MSPASCDSSSICARPSAATIASAVRLDPYIFSNTSLAIEPLIVPFVDERDQPGQPRRVPAATR